MSENCFDKKVVIFDLDGCLVDTTCEIALMLNRTRETLGLPPKEEAFVKSCIGGGLRKLFEKCMTDAPDQLEEALRRAPGIYLEISGSMAQPFPHVVETLQKLQGKRKVGLATNKIRSCTEKLFDALDITKYFDFMCCADDCDRVKPDPQCVQLVLEHLGATPDEAVMVGDTPVDVKTADNAGVDTIAVTYGMALPEVVRAANPKYCVDSMEKVLALLLPEDER